MKANVQYIKQFVFVLCVIIIFASLWMIFFKNKKKNLTVFCSSMDDVDSVYIEQTKYIVSKLDAKKIRIIYGGQTAGLMGVVAKTFRENGGEVIGVNYDKFDDGKVVDDYVYDNLRERQGKLIDMGDEYLVLPGGVGTTLELFDVMVSNNIADFNKKIHVYNVNGLYNHLLEYIKQIDKGRFIKDGIPSLNIVVSSDADKIARDINK